MSQGPGLGPDQVNVCVDTQASWADFIPELGYLVFELDVPEEDEMRQ